MSKFSLQLRGQMWYCRFKNPDTGKWTTAKSTGETARDAAIAWAYHAIKYGIPEKGGRTAADLITVDTILTNIRTAERLDPDDVERILRTLADRGYVISGTPADSPATEDTVVFLLRFWTWNESPYVREKLCRGHAITKGHVANRYRWIMKYWEPVFRGVPLVQLTRGAIRDFADSLSEKPITAGTRNHVLLSGTVALRWAHQNEILRTDVTTGIKSYSGTTKRRGTLTLDEAESLFSLTWADERARLANLTAALTGLRQGEIVALRLQDIGDDRLYVRNARGIDGTMKSTKTGATREVPILPALRDALRDQAGRSPYPTGPGSFVFWSTVTPDRPMDPRPLTLALYDALLRLHCTDDEVAGAKRADVTRNSDKKPDDDDIRAERKVSVIRDRWRSRNINFHSWRHFYSSTLAGKLDARTVMSATGHRSESVFAQYADHVNAERFERVAQAAGETFGRIVRFPGADRDDTNEE